MAALAHPPAATRRQQERDHALVAVMGDGLSDAQADLLWAFLNTVTGYAADPLLRLADVDLADAAAALAATIETADRGLIYEHRPSSLSAQRLLTDLRTVLTSATSKLQASAATRTERDGAVVLRQVERAVRRAQEVEPGGGPSLALGMIGRVVKAVAQAGADRGPVEPARPMLIRP